MYDKNILRTLLMNREYLTVNEDGKVFMPSHKVFQRVADAMIVKGSPITAKHVHTIVNNNRGGMYDDILRAFSIKAENGLNISEDPSFNVSERSTIGQTHDRKFRLIIPAVDWAKIKPTSKKSATRKYYVLKANRWTSTFARKIWQQTKITCAFTFKRAKVYVADDEKCYTKFVGDCRECGAHLTGMSPHKPREKADVIFECQLTGIRPEVEHKKKRQLKGYLREKVARELVDGGKSASAWRIEEANRLMETGDNIPPILFDGNVLRKAKQQKLEHRLELSGTDPIENLYAAKYTTLQNTIQVISKDPFFCIYWTKAQQAMYAAAQKYDRGSSFIIDATGGVGKKIKLPDGGQSPHLFLYQCVCVSNTGNFPVFQCISAAQNAATITYFLFHVARNNPLPRTVVSDFGRAILIAVARAFCGTDLSYYLQSCYSIVVSNASESPPKCFIRLDVSHLMAMVTRWPSLKGKLSKVRQFYLRSVGRIYKMNSFDQIQALIKSVLVVALSQDIGLGDDDEILPSEVHLRNVASHIKGIENQYKEELTDQDAQKLNSDEEEIEQSQSWNHWANLMYNEAQEIASNCQETGSPSAYYNPEAAKRLIDLAAYLPLWTGLMRPYFNLGDTIASSAYVEAEFSKVKRVFQGQLPMRVDKFILGHINYINGTLLMASGEASTKIQHQAFDNHDKPSEDDGDIEVDVTLGSVIAGVDDCDAETIDSTNNNDCAFQPENDVRHSYYVVSDDEEFAERKKADTNKDFTDTEAIIKDNILETDGNDSENGDAVRTENDTGFDITTECISKNETRSQLVENNPLNEYENWKGKANPRKESGARTIVTRAKPNYLDPCPDWDLIPNHKCIGIPLMLNGNLCNAAIVGNTRIVVSQTCALDSLLQIFANALASFECYKKNVLENQNTFLELAQSIVKSGKLNVHHYRQRAIILRAIPILDHRIKTRHVETLNAKCNAGHLYEYLFPKLPSYTVTTNCHKCHHIAETSYAYLNVNVNILLQEGFCAMQDSIGDVPLQNKSRCTKCKTAAMTTNAYGPQIMVDTSVLTDLRYLASLDFKVTECALDNIAKTVAIGHQTYTLAGVADFQKAREHYTALILTGLSWYEYDDTKKTRLHVSGKHVVHPHVIIYIKTSA